MRGACLKLVVFVLVGLTSLFFQLSALSCTLHKKKIITGKKTKNNEIMTAEMGGQEEGRDIFLRNLTLDETHKNSLTLNNLQPLSLYFAETMRNEHITSLLDMELRKQNENKK